MDIQIVFYVILFYLVAVAISFLINEFLIPVHRENRKKKKEETPPLPARIRPRSPSTTISTDLPVSTTKNRNKEEAFIVYGPYGVSPIQFPCCPYDKQRNLPGNKQLIFWDRKMSCYRCSRGHMFKSNGKPF